MDPRKINIVRNAANRLGRTSGWEGVADELRKFADELEAPYNSQAVALSAEQKRIDTAKLRAHANKGWGDECLLPKASVLRIADELDAARAALCITPAQSIADTAGAGSLVHARMALGRLDDAKIIMGDEWFSALQDAYSHIERSIVEFSPAVSNIDTAGAKPVCDRIICHHDGECARDDAATWRNCPHRTPAPSVAALPQGWRIEPFNGSAWTLIESSGRTHTYHDRPSCEEGERTVARLLKALFVDVGRANVVAAGTKPTDAADAARWREAVSIWRTKSLAVFRNWMTFSAGKVE